MVWIFGFYIFFLGLAFGSFALAMVDRMKAGKDWVRGRSECDHCKHKLAARDLVPLVSWLVQRGRCRHCRKKLSIGYPLAEIGLGLAFLCSFLFWPVELSGGYAIVQFIVWLTALVILAGLFIFDVRWFLLPSKLIYPLVVLGVVFAWIGVQLERYTLLDVGVAVVVGFGVFAFLFAISKGRWIGDGDVRFGVVMGLFAGGPFEVWFAIFLASVIGLFVAMPILLKANKKSRLKLKVPFGPMLITGLYVTVLFGAQFVAWYKMEILLL